MIQERPRVELNRSMSPSCAATTSLATIDGDAGGLILRLREGAPPPRVHVKGMAGMVKVEMM
ncbi:MAG: hypothetical protein WAW26_23125 [Anaerolineae bacterium]